MLREYRLNFAPASGVTHGEWTTLDRYALERCVNPLHGGHRIPRSDESTVISSGFVEVLVGMVEDVIAAYVAAVESPSLVTTPNAR
jgi:hypothetical protein